MESRLLLARTASLKIKDIAGPKRRYVLALTCTSYYVLVIGSELIRFMGLAFKSITTDANLEI